MNDKQISKLAQIVAEDTYSRSNIRERVFNDIFDSSNIDLKEVYGLCCSAVNSYMYGEYYKSKQNRLQCIAHIPTKDIVIEIFMAVIPNNTVTSIQKVAGAIGQWLEYEDVFDGVKTAAELLAITGKCGLHEMTRGNDSESGYMSIKSLWNLEPETINFIDRTKFLNPMITKPDDWTNNSDGGYITTKRSVFLGKHNHGMHDQALDALNILQDIEWELDEHMLQYEELPKKPLDTPEKAANFNRLANMTKVVKKELMDEGNNFWFQWRYDFRGRAYNSGYYVSLQANDARKAALNFKHKQLITG